jgi:hypothetical protein
MKGITMTKLKNEMIDGMLSILEDRDEGRAKGICGIIRNEVALMEHELSFEQQRGRPVDAVNMGSFSVVLDEQYETILNITTLRGDKETVEAYIAANFSPREIHSPYDCTGQRFTMSTELVQICESYGLWQFREVTGLDI